jgi:Na+/proline symporter
MFIAAMLLVNQLPENVGFGDAVSVAGKLGKLNVVDFSFDLDNRYTFWTGMLGGFFLFVSYFGTDQSQVQRYLSGRSLSESRLGLMFNGIIKVPMQVMVLFVGILVFVFFLFVKPPIHFNTANLELVKENPQTAASLDSLEMTYDALFVEREQAVNQMVKALKEEDEATVASATQEVSRLTRQDSIIRAEVRGLIDVASDDKAKTRDTDYVFITFVINYLPIGLVGLILAVIFSAAMSSTASELNALATTTVIDLYKRSFAPDATDEHYLWASKGFTILWGCIALFFALYADLFDNLIQAVNIIGSLMYGAILGVFIVAFFQKRIGGVAVFRAALITELIVLCLFALNEYEYIHLAYLWLNPIGCILVMLFAELFQGRNGSPSVLPDKVKN